jgi:hypothetical protein
LRQYIDAAASVDLPEKLTETITVNRGFSSSAKPVNQIVVINRVEIRSDVETNAMLVSVVVVLQCLFVFAIGRMDANVVSARKPITERAP